MKNKVFLLVFLSTTAFAGKEGGAKPVGSLVYQIGGPPPVMAGAETVASAANNVMSMTSQPMPSTDFSGLHQQVRQAEERTQIMRNQIQSLNTVIDQYNTPIKIAEAKAVSDQVVSYAKMSAGDKVALASNRWITKKVETISNRLGSNLASYSTTDFSREIATWTTFSNEKKQVLLLADDYAATAAKLKTDSSMHPETLRYADLALESGVETLTEASLIAGGHASGDFSEKLGVSEAQLEIGKAILDVGLGLTPGVSIGKDAYEAITGKSLIDGSQLDFTSRSFAVLGVATAGGSNILKNSFKGLLKIAEAARAKSFLGHGFESAIKLTESNVINVVKHSPISQGVLHQKMLGDEIAQQLSREFHSMRTVSDTFRSGTYISYQITKPRFLYRLASTSSDKVAMVKDFSKTWAHKSNFWTSTPPSSPTQSMIDLALERSWGSRANVWIKIEVPAGQTLHEGVSAGIQRIGHNMSEFVGGGNQIYFNSDVPREWIKEIRTFVE